MLAPCFLALLPLAQTPLRAPVWYGPATVAFPGQFGGNPYDPDENDIRVRFFPEKGKAVERIAYFDEAGGGYRAVLVAPQPGKYRAVLLRNGKPAEGTEPKPVTIKERLPRGYLRRHPSAANRLRWENGETYWPIGFNLGGQIPGPLPIREQIAKMGAAGATWTRFWTSPGDDKDPWWPQNDPGALPDQLWAPALAKRQELVDASNAAGVGFQMVLFNGGSFGSRLIPAWADHPWNAAKGGFLKDAADFFTDAEAKRRTKMWLRYAVARYAHSPSLVAWELFGKVEGTDAAQSGRWADVNTWHAEMAAYLRSLDPYGHLVTTSAALDQPGLWTAMDFYQPHASLSDVRTPLAALPLPTDKPAFYGETRLPEGGEARDAVRDTIYGAMFANHAGAAMHGSPDRVEKDDLYGEYRTAARVLALSGLADRPAARRVAVVASPATTTALGQSDWLMVRLTAPSGTPLPVTVPLSGLSLADASYDLSTVDLDTGEVRESRVTVSRFTLEHTLSGRDTVLIFKRRP